MRIQFIALMLSAALLGGCATPLRVPLTDTQRAAIKGVDSKVIVVQDEVLVDVRPSSSMGAGVMFGLVGVLVTSIIDSKVTNSRMRSAQDLMVPFYTSLEDLDYRRDFAAALQGSAADLPFKLSSITSTPVNLTNEQLRKWRSDLAAGQNLMIVVPRYRLSADFRTFYSETWVTLWDKGDEDKPVNRSVLRYQSAPQGPGDADSMQAWSANGAAAFRNVVRDSLAETMALLKTDLKLGDTSAKPQQERETSFLDNGVTLPLKGIVIKEVGDRMHFLSNDGRLFSLPKLSGTEAK